jgi:TolB-like protein/Flp pilus assembly protein TadD
MLLGRFGAPDFWRRIVTEGALHDVSLRTILAELRHRGVFKVAAAYAAIGWVLLEVLSVLFQNFGAPDWIVKVATTLILAGFPVACLMAWGFDITPEGVRPVPLGLGKSVPQPENAVSGPDAVVEPGPTPSVAVLAFDNFSAEPEQAYFSDGIAEDIITDLSRLSQLRVIARNSSFTYKGRPVDVRQVGRELGARYVLEGSVRKAGQRVRVASQLTDTTTGSLVWAERFDRDLTDIFAVQDEISLEIIEALTIKLTPEMEARLTRRAAVDLEARNLFLRGREHAYLLTANGGAEARKLLERAIAISPDFAAALAFIAFTLVEDYVMGRGDDPQRSLESGLAIARRACALDDQDPYAHWSLSMALLWSRQHDEAMVAVRDSLALAPNLADGHMQLANLQYYMGDIEGALKTLDTYMQLDPLYPEIALYFLAEAQAASGHFDDAVATLKRRLERNPNSATSYALLASCYGHLGRIEESREAWAQVLRNEPGFSLERRRRVLPYRTPEIFERRIEGLRKAGLQL